ncbi:propionyl-CoA synthetase [Aquisalimonas lutea]|uniref:propionyl-CoA synthetase n=1 Tax=Aquisalimonas lutea TaxID=1327750 RepID=UPI0025B45E2D|nr:propionyl-CoA synthetase [Aquisalimonas lutea]MDN3516159.1 propionyl-CoA synthetase [Aquisalimonas lutea]
MNYAALYQRSIDDPEGFWGEQAQALDWFRPPQQVLGRDDQGLHRWFQGGELNMAHLALDHHVNQGRGGQTAIIHDSPATGTQQRYTYTELRDAVATCAGALRELGVAKGDRVVLYMPMIPEAVIGMLACARLGAIHAVVFGGFSPHELAVRIDDAAPRVILTAGCGMEFTRVIPYKPLVDEAISQARHKPEAVVVKARPQADAELQPGRDHDWDALMAGASPADPVPVDATHPLYILHTSGTTGKPKGVLRDTGGYAVALNFSMGAVYDLHPGEVFWTASDVGWVVGHSYIVYAPLIRGCTSVVYEGKPVKTPDAGAFWRVIAEHGVKTFFTAPTAFRAVKKEDPDARHMADHDLSCLKALFLAGERLDPPTYDWLKRITGGRPVIDHWWQTETGWPIAANPLGIEPQPEKSGSATFPAPGYQVEILAPGGERLGRGEQGHIAIRLPLPPGCLPTLWNDDARFRSSYLERFPGYYDTSDGGYIDEDGYLFVMGRVDDVINVAGHRLSTGEMEEIIGSHEAVAECAVVGIADELKGEMPVGFVVLKDGAEVDHGTLETDLVEMVRRNIGAFACLRSVAIVQKLPKTRSGKVLRKSIRQLSSQAEVPVPPTIDDPSSLDEIRDAMHEQGIGQHKG